MDVKKVTEYVGREFPGFGLNKHHAIVRLLLEICRKHQTTAECILPKEIIRSKDFFQIKAFLLKLRYPSLLEMELKTIPPLTEIHADKKNCVDHSDGMPEPKRVFFETAVADSDLLFNLRQKLPSASFEEITRYSDYVKKYDFSITDYNRRQDTLFLIKEDYDLFLDCPCSRPSRPCGYHIMNAGMGCPFDCVYCYLQGYVNAPGITLPENLDEMLEHFSAYYHPGLRMGTGQFTDSLVFDHLTGFSAKIIHYFRRYPDALFEFKTKSDNIQNILDTPASDNIVISWSVNPPRIIDSVEFFTASLSQRLEAAKKCVNAGYRVGFHFDPIIYYDGWEDDYHAVVQHIFELIDPGQIAWISLGCLRMTLKVRQVMEQRFPDSVLTLAEQIVGFDGKLRYPWKWRKKIYEQMLKMIGQYRSDICVYLCMEDEKMNRELDIPVVQGCVR